MAEHTESLGSVFFPSDEETAQGGLQKPDESAPASELEASELTTELEEKLKAESKNVRTAGMSARIVETLADVLAEVGILDGVLVKVWKEAKLFDKYLNPDAYPAGDVIAVTLAEHKIPSKHKPRVEVQLNDMPIKEIEFEVVLTLSLKGAIIDIKNGEIIGIRPGECSATGTVKWNDIVLASKKSDPVRLPGYKRFDPPIRIAP